MGLIASFRQLCFESLTLTLAELKAQVEAVDDGPRKLPPFERTARRDAFIRAFPGFQLIGDQDPSYALHSWMFVRRWLRPLC